MNKEEFIKTYENFGAKDKINICCDICGKLRFLHKEKARQNIETNRLYSCASCSMKKKHDLNPFTEETKEKQRLGRLGKKHSKESRLAMSESRKALFNSPDGPEMRKTASRTAAEGHATGRFQDVVRKGLFPSEKNQAMIAYNSSYELRACVELEENPEVKYYQTQIYYEYEGRAHSLDFLIEYMNGSKSSIEIKPKSRLNEADNILQLSDSSSYAASQGWNFDYWTEEHFGMTERELRIWADEYRNKLGLTDFDYEEHRKQLDRDKANRHYAAKIATDTILVRCNYCNADHTALRLTYDKNIARNGRYICEKEGGHIAGSLPKPHLRKENPYLAEGKKQCTKCQGILLLEEFGDDKSRADGKASRCKKCRSVDK